jgi:hypothetical protein
MTVHETHGDPGEDLPFPFGEFKHPSPLEREKIILEKTRSVALGGNLRGAPVFGLDIIPGMGKRGDRLSVQKRGRTAGMVKMKVGEYHIGDPFRRHPEPGK